MSDIIFTQPAPEGAGKKVSEVLGEIAWLMSRLRDVCLRFHPSIQTSKERVSADALAAAWHA